MGNEGTNLLLLEVHDALFTIRLIFDGDGTDVSGKQIDEPTFSSNF